VRTAVIGHVEWIEFVPVEEVPRAGEIAHAGEPWEQAGGGGAVAAIQLALLAEETTLYTTLGADEPGRRVKAELEALGVQVHATSVDAPTRRAITYVDDSGERTITTLGPRLDPRGHDEALPWEALARCDAAYFCAGDPDALVHARRARVLVATARELPTLRRAGVVLDALVGSGEDEAERYESDLDPGPSAVVSTSGRLGGWTRPGGPFTAAPLPGPIADTYGAGDCFAAGLAFALGRGVELADAVSFASRCGAGALTGRGVHALAVTL
jgi:ribokinase